MAIPYSAIIELDEGWQFIETGITKLKRILEGIPEPQFNCEEYMMLYTTIFNMCSQRAPHDYSRQLYGKYKEAFHEYINSMVMPSLRDNHDEFMLRELVQRWSNHKIMVRWLSRFFSYLDRYFIPRRSLPSLNEVGLTCFRDKVYEELKGKATYAVIALIDREREGEQIDRALLKNVLDMYVEIGMGEMDYYVNDFEKDMLDDSAAYYSRKASNWIAEGSRPDYLLKAEDCLRKERERVSHYLHPSSEPKLLENVLNGLLAAHSSPLLEKEHFGFHSLLRDEKVDDLSRMHRLFSRIVKGLHPVTNLFKQITVEGMALVQLAEDAACNMAENVGGLQEHGMMPNEAYEGNPWTSIQVMEFVKKVDMFPHVLLAYKILLTVPVMVASAERNFSKLKLLKLYLRTTMSQERLNGPLMRHLRYSAIKISLVAMVRSSWLCIVTTSSRRAEARS